jgi:uncharacterized protein YdeI (YjbR/CyaY-like superfamily)
MTRARPRGLTAMTYGATIELAERPRVLDVPERMADVLDDDDIARRAFARLSYEQQRWLVLTVGADDPAAVLRAVP